MSLRFCLPAHENLPSLVAADCQCLVTQRTRRAFDGDWLRREFFFAADFANRLVLPFNTPLERPADVDLILTVESFREIVDIEEISQLIVIRLAHFPTVDQFENHPAEIVGGMDPPAMENGSRQESELFLGVLANPLQKLGTRNMRAIVIRPVRLRSPQILLGATKRREHEAVRIRVKSQAREWGRLECAHDFSRTCRIRRNRRE
jgi:hypothetical protein